jgi:hypothetical protein
VTAGLTDHLAVLPADLSDAIADTLKATIEHFIRREWDDTQVDAGRFCEATLRYLEWKMTGRYTPIDGKQKPSRKSVIGNAKNDVTLPPSLRAQVPQAIELVMDFRNNRNSAHLGDISPNKMDAACVVQNVSWIGGELARIESHLPPREVQEVIDRLAERHVPLVQVVGNDRVVLNPALDAAQRALILLLQEGQPVPVMQLRNWVDYGNSTRWRRVVLKGLQKKRFIHVDRDDNVTLLRPGEAAAERLMLDDAA